MKGIHGGDIYRNQVKLDFSVNVNPLGVPEEVTKKLYKAVEQCSVYPDIAAERLRQSVSKMLSVPEEYLLFGNGASELFLAAVHGMKPEKIVIPVPSFYGYEYAARASGADIFFYETKREEGFQVTEDICTALTEDVDLLFLASPGNPAGRMILGETLRHILAHCKKNGITVVLDECFVEFCGGKHSLVSEADSFENLIIIRAFTKIFAIPGVRLGYLICGQKELRGSIAQQLPEWNLSCFAQAAGIACAKLEGCAAKKGCAVGDGVTAETECAAQAGFIEKTVNLVQCERAFLSERLQQMGIFVFPSEANFLMIYSRTPLYEKLIQKGILIRDCANFRGLSKGYYRIAVKTRKENEILLRAIKEGEQNSHRFFENRACKYFPCHKGLSDFNCLFCYCPLYAREDCPGNPRFLERDGRRIKDCSGCTFPHRPQNYDAVVRRLAEDMQKYF